MPKTLHQSYFFAMMCVGIVTGTILVLIFRWNFFASPWWILCALILFVYAYFHPTYIFIVIALVAGMILAFYRSAGELTDSQYIAGFYGKTVEVVGIVNGDPEMDDGMTSFKMSDLKFGDERNAGGNIYVTLASKNNVRRGDKVELTGVLGEGFGTYSGALYRPQLKNVARPEPGNLVVRVRDWFAERIRAVVAEPEVDLGLAYLLGMKGGLPNDLNENLRNVGLTHIVVASGAHLSILVEIARRIFGKFSRFAGLLFSILFILFFMAMVGWTPSILRAGIMSILTLSMWYVGRKFAPWRIILITMAITLLIEPMFLTNLGWLLSFASFIGIMMLGPKLTNFLYGEEKVRFVPATIITTAAATLMTLPISLYYFGSLSLISVVANLLILPTLPYVMGLTFLTGVFSGVPILDGVLGFLTTFLLDFHIKVVEFFGAQTMLIINVPTGSWWVFLLYVPVLGILLWRCGVRLDILEKK